MKTCQTCQRSFPTQFAVCPEDGTPLDLVEPWSDGTVIRGKYRILGKLGQGGMGAVYKALHLRFRELRALKVLAPELAGDRTFLKRFEHEAVLTRKLVHPNAVRVEDIDESEDGRPFIVMEYIDGQSLRQTMEAAGPMPATQVCMLVKQVAAALDAAHKLGIVHRDVKPDNIIIVGDTAKVLDFGIAKIKEEISPSTLTSLTATGMAIGTPPYMSPEQALGKRGEDLDARSDIYSLGVVMYQMLTAELPIRGDTPIQVLIGQINAPPIPIRDARPGLAIGDGLADLVMNCLEKERDLRPRTAMALVEAIEHWEFGEIKAGRDLLEGSSFTDALERLERGKAIHCLVADATELANLKDFDRAADLIRGGLAGVYCGQGRRADKAWCCEEVTRGGLYYPRWVICNWSNPRVLARAC